LKHHRAAPDALRFYAELQERASVAACAKLFKSAVSRFGIVAFACGEVDLGDRNRSVVFIAEWPEAWLRHDVKSGFSERGPVVDAVAFHRKPFEFTDITREPRFSNGEPEAVEAAAEYGWSRGLAVPVPRGGTRFGLVTMIGRGAALSEFERAYLCLISECLLTRIRALGEGVQYALPPAGMSKREIEAARLVALGCSDADIAAHLGISESTAHKHVESGRRRLRAKNRAHMAALSLSLGIATSAQLG
jgi:DNA-binding CsgD family transcriptional regulator